MQIFEFHFNPKNEDGAIFDSFCFEPANVYEKRMGGLYMIGLLKNVLPQNVRFLDKLVKVIREKYYKTISSTPERSLRESLKKANDYLEQIAKTGDVSWLGNLNFGVVAAKNSELHFTKTGDLKIVLMRRGQVVDIDDKLKFEGIEPFPLKVFGNIVSGKLAENDIVLISTKNIYGLLFQEKILAEIARISISSKLPEDIKRIKEAIDLKKERLLRTYGVCLLLILSKENIPKERETLVQKKPLKIFSVKKVFAPIIERLSFFRLYIKKPTIKIPKTNLKIPKIKISIRKPNIKLSLPNIPAFRYNKKLTIILALILFLTLGFYIFKMQEEGKMKNYQETLDRIKEKMSQAETYLIVAENSPSAKESANSLIKESWQELSPLLKEVSFYPSTFVNQVLTLKENISEHLYQINNMVEIEEPELVYEFKPKEYIPNKLIYSNQNLYLFSPYSKNIFEIKTNKETRLISTEKEISAANVLNNYLLFFTKPDQIIIFLDEIVETLSLSPPYSDFEFSDLSSFKSNLYLLDKNRQRVIKYPYITGNQWGSPQMWLSTKNATDFESMTVDGSVWILTEGNKINRYYSGDLQKTISPDIFPEAEDLSKIFTSDTLPYLYLSEPNQKRIIILDKVGQIIKQFQSEKFDSILDFSVSKDGKEVYILNGLKVYKINF